MEYFDDDFDFDERLDKILENDKKNKENLTNGNDVYQKKLQTKIENLLSDNWEYNFLEGFYNYMAGASENTCYNYLLRIIAFLNNINKPIEKIQVDDYTSFLASIKSYTPSYVTTTYSALKKFSEYLYVTKKNPEDSMRYIKKPKMKERQETKEKREKGYLTKTEIKKVLSLIDSGIENDKRDPDWREWRLRDKLIFLIFLSTGIRASALWKLDVDSIDFEKGILKVTDKGGYVNEHVLPEEVLKITSYWLAKRKSLLGGASETALFISKKKQRLSGEAISLMVKKYTSAAVRDKNITPHKLRATFGTQVYNATHDIYLTQKAMNHTSPKVTELYVRGNVDSTKKTAASVMDNVLFDRKKGE